MQTLPRQKAPWEIILRQKMKLWLALLLLIILAIIAGFAISVKAAGLIFGGRITGVVYQCSRGLPTPTCPGTICLCRLCGCVAAPCSPPPAKWSQIIFRPAGGNATYICPAVGFPYRGGFPAAGKFILGNGFNSYFFRQIGVSR